MREWFIRWSRTPKSRLLSAVVFLFFFVVTVAQGKLMYALGWLSLLVSTGLTHASEGIARSRTLVSTLAYVAIGFLVLGVLLLVTLLVRDLFSLL